MAKVKGAVLGINSGKIGQVCYRVTKGTQFAGRMPVVSDNRKYSSLQMDNFERFKVLGRLGASFMGASRIGLKHLMTKAYDNAVSVFVQKNQGAVSVMGGEAEVDYGSLKCADGTLPQPGFGNASFAEPQRVSVTYSTSADAPDADAQDKVYIFIYQPDTRQAMLSAPALRTTGTIEIRVPSSWTGLSVHVYGFAVGDGRENKGMIAESTYIGTGIIA